MRVFQYWVKLVPAPDVPGEWVAHCLDFDVVTQGHGLFHAMTMAHEAVAMVVLDDLEHGHDPTTRRAPKVFWNEMYEVLQRARPVELRDLAAAPAPEGIVYANLELAVAADDGSGDASGPEGIALVA